MAPDFKDFYSIDSSLTPGVAGALTTSIALPLVSSFTALKFPWVALGVSFILSLVIIAASSENISLGKRCLYCLLNTLIIFAIAFGAYSKINKPPTTDLIPPNLFSLSCEILDKTPMDESNRKLIKSLLQAHSAQPSNLSWIDLLGPSPALAQPGSGQPLSPGGTADAGAGPASPPRDTSAQPNPSSVPKASPKDLEEAKKYQLKQEKIRKEQDVYHYQSTF
jgi:hypothetical protein